MPRDLVEIEVFTECGPVEKTLRAAKALIDRPEKWHRLRCFSVDRKAACAGGAIVLALNPNLHNNASNGITWSSGPSDFVQRFFQRANEMKGLVSWNDAPERSHADVMTAFDKAIMLAHAEGK